MKKSQVRLLRRKHKAMPSQANPTKHRLLYARSPRSRRRVPGMFRAQQVRLTQRARCKVWQGPLLGELIKWHLWGEEDKKNW